MTPTPRPPQPSYAALFGRFLRFGLLAWGGPVVQIAKLRQELVDDEAWVSSERFNRVLAVYQVLPGPEATELCVYFGTLARGRLGGLLAGLGFILPGLLLMLLLAWFYVTYGLRWPLLAGAFYGMQAVVGALIIRAVHRIGGHVLLNRELWALALFGCVAQLAEVPFWWTLLGAGLVYVLVKRGQTWLARGLWAAALLSVGGWWLSAQPLAVASPTVASVGANGSVAPLTLFGSGLRSGLLTFGGAYTVIPYLQNDAVRVGGWMSNAQFLDGLALSGILPAPLVIFGTFVGYLGGGLLGALALTTGIFLPAFSITLIGHDWLERLVDHTALHNFLDGVTAGVVGLIAATSLKLLPTALSDWGAVALFLGGLFILYRWSARWSTPLVVLGAAAVGIILHSL